MKKLLRSIVGRSGANRLRSIETVAKGLWLGLGNDTLCPICNYTYSHFLPFRHRKNALCPNCRSLERHRLIHLYLRDKTDFFTTPKRILHFAPEKCWYTRFKTNPLFQYETADYMVSFMDNIGAAPDHVMSIDDIKFPDHSFDVVIAIGILLLVPDDGKALGELHRVLKPGGYAVLEDPIKPGETEEYDLSTPEAQAESRRKYGHLQYRYYGEHAYARRMEEYGFRVVRSEYALELDRHRFGLGGHRYVHIAYKTQAVPA